MNAKRQRGFTLLELLVAVTLTSIVILGLMAVFRNMVTVYAEIRESRENTMQMRALIGLLGDDLLTMSREFPFIGSTGESGGRVVIDNAGKIDRHGVRLLEFVSGVSVERQEAPPSLAQILVVYSVIRFDDEDQWTLMRGERPYPSIDGEWDKLPMPVLRHVETLKFYYEWPSGAVQDFCSIPPGGALPAFVRLEVALRQGEKTAGYSLRFPIGRRSQVL